MRLGQLASVKTWLPASPLAADPFWDKQVASVSEIEIQFFYARASVQGLRRESVDAIDALQAAVITSAFNGELSEPPAAVILHEPPTEPFMVDELVDGLVRLKPVRRRAVLWALERREDPQATADLTWKRALQLRQLPGTCQDILALQDRTRHMKVPYVFWEWATEQIAAPLLEFKWTVEQAFHCTWPELTLRYRRMIKVHRGADAAHLMLMAENLSKN